MKTNLTPREFAQAIGSSESSVKRWIDSGEIEASRTAGGHRRVALIEAVRYARENSLTVVRPEVLGLSDLTAYRGRKFEETDPEKRLFDCLQAGLEEEARGLMIAHYLEGGSVAQLIDGPIRSAMARVGELWTAEHSGVFWEHRATQIVMQSLVRLRSLQAVASDAPLAVGGAPAGDAYMLPSLAVATVLEAQGIRAVNLGAETPIETLALGVEDLSARVAWLSVSVTATPARLREEILSVLPAFAERGTTLVVGGASASKLKLPASEQVYVGTSMAELEALLAGMKLGKFEAGSGRGRLRAS